MYNLGLTPDGKLMLVSANSPDKLLTMSEAEFTQAGYNWTDSYTFTGSGFDVVVPPPPPEPTLEEQKATKLQQLEARLYDAYEAGYLNTYRAHEINQAQYARQLQLVNEAINLGVMTENDTIQWFGKAGTETGTVVQYRLFMVNYGFWVQTITATFYSKEIAINAAQTIEELNAITIELQ